MFQKVEIKSSVLVDLNCRWLSDIHVAIGTERKLRDFCSSFSFCG